MMGLFNTASSTASGVLNRVVKPRGSVEAENDKAPSDTEPDDTSILSVTPFAPSVLYRV